jgi:hypothetical protein
MTVYQFWFVPTRENRMGRTLPAAEKVPIAVPIAAHAPNASGSDLALTPAMNPAAHPPAAAFNASFVWFISGSLARLGEGAYLTHV